MYFCIDMKCFFASVECVERGLNPAKTALVVADESRGKGALCLAVSPYFKAIGATNRSRLYELPPNIPYIIAKPRMQKYIDYAVWIHRIFLNYVSSEDIHTYSIDEAFLDVGPYCSGLKEVMILAEKIVTHIQTEIGIVSACGIGENLYLAKLSLDLKAKHSKRGIYFLSKEKFYKEIWPLTSLEEIWQIGKGIQKRLHLLGLYTLKDVALANPDLLEREFGVIGLDLYEHAWGNDDTTIADIKSYTPKSKSFSRRQILFEDYTKEDAWIPLIEMLYLLCMDLFMKQVGGVRLSISIGFSKGQQVFKKSISLETCNNHYFDLKEKIRVVYQEVPNLPIRKIGLTMSGLVERVLWENTLFFSVDTRVDNLCKAILNIWEKYGKNKLVIGTALLKQSTLYQRNKQIGGHNRDE